MRILHVSIGRAPFYTGGSVRYAEDLIKQQRSNGHEVSILIPGSSSLFPKIKIHSSTAADGLLIHEIINPLPIPLMAGIKTPLSFIDHHDIHPYETFLALIKPEVIHVHSIMGIHQAFFDTAKASHIPLIFTTHDYFPICVRCTLIDANHHLCTQHDAKKCAACNIDAGLPPLWEFLIRSKTYRKIKHTPWIKKVRLWARKTQDPSPSVGLFGSTSTLKDLNQLSASINPSLSAQYERLLKHYADILSTFTMIHCNSEIAKQVYTRYYPQLTTTVIPITHNDLPEEGHLRTDFNGEFRIGYLGGRSVEKGLFALIEAVKQIPVLPQIAFNLILWGDDYTTVANASPLIKNRGKFKPDQLDLVFSSMDILVVPSLWYETFGFVVLEALAYGLPVVCSDRVGASMLLGKCQNQLVYPADQSTQLAKILLDLSNIEHYTLLATEISKLHRRPQFDDHNLQIEALYKQMLLGQRGTTDGH